MASKVTQLLKFPSKLLAFYPFRDASLDIVVDDRTLVSGWLRRADALVLLFDELRIYDIADPIFLFINARRTGIEVAMIVMALSATDQMTDFVASSSCILVK